ncbi:cupredoxin domain-containing protein [Candidatus Gottesmanbacteria bacterium]|nr:cupredoxin domain-containing protein [Candidatus Gottesmanbacteria bacterium]
MRILKKLSFVITLCLVGIVVSALLMYRNSVTRGGSKRVVTNSVTISMREDEYIPNSLTVKKGTKVVFFNATSVARWPASNLHPSHLMYPEFDPKEPVLPGKSWDFVFGKIGTWEMHDHLAPYITGVITVIE